MSGEFRQYCSVSWTMRASSTCATCRLRSRYRADLLLVRPDQHVAWRGSQAGDAAAVLSRVLGEPVAAAR